MTSRSPIEPFQAPASKTSADVAGWIETIETLPGRLIQSLGRITDAKLETPYRPGGWTRKQVVHHIADSHINSYVRFKWALTEPNPTIKAYDENLWAELPDYSESIEVTLGLIGALHARWGHLLRGINSEQLARTFHHPESGESVDLATNVAIYAWHGDHHLAQIELP